MKQIVVLDMPLPTFRIVSALGFGLPWCNSAIGRISGDGGADLLVADAPYIDALPPTSVGWLGVFAPLLAGCSVLVLVVHRTAGTVIAVISLLIFLAFAIFIN